MRLVTHHRRPVRAAVGPNASALPIRTPIHAVVDPYVWQTLYTWPRL